jgi:hypothetical protein
MKDARIKATSGDKQQSGALAQMLAVTAMLIIAFIVVYAR